MHGYFILSKSKDKSVSDSSSDQIITFNKESIIYILPYNNLCYHHQKGLFESTLIEWCKIFGDTGKVMLDVGAHTGTYSLGLCRHFKEVHSFEPQRLTYYSLCGSVALSKCNNIYCHQYGLGNVHQVGSQVLKIISLDGGGSGLHNTEGVIGSEVIEIKTLDSYNFKNVGFIKIDVEGNELQVLEGAADTIKNNEFPKILFECNGTNESLFEYIKKLGYSIIHINGYSNMYLAQK